MHSDLRKEHIFWTAGRTASDWVGLWLAALMAVISMAAATAAPADDVRMDVLTSSYLIENLVSGGNWEIKAFDKHIDYVCLACGGELVARLEVIVPYESGQFSSRHERYLAERRQRCFDLAADRIGRCVDTRTASVRIPLGGFQSETELSSGREIEIVFFYHGPYWPGPELIKTTIYISGDATLPEHSVEMFMWHMARLTVFW